MVYDGALFYYASRCLNSALGLRGQKRLQHETLSGDGPVLGRCQMTHSTVGDLPMKADRLMHSESGGGRKAGFLETDS